MLFIILSALVFTPYVASEHCFVQRCLGCHPSQTISTGHSADCHPSNWVTAEWVHNLGHPPPTTGSELHIEYRCLKMVATPDDTTFGATVDVIRGCIPRIQIDSVCLALVAVERARGHSDAKCFICNGENCNSAAHAQINLYIPLAAIILYYVLR